MADVQVHASGTQTQSPSSSGVWPTSSAPRSNSETHAVHGPVRRRWLRARRRHECRLVAASSRTSVYRGRITPINPRACNYEHPNESLRAHATVAMSPAMSQMAAGHLLQSFTNKIWPPRLIFSATCRPSTRRPIYFEYTRGDLFYFATYNFHWRLVYTCSGQASSSVHSWNTAWYLARLTAARIMEPRPGLAPK